MKEGIPGDLDISNDIIIFKECLLRCCSLITGSRLSRYDTDGEKQGDDAYDDSFV